MWDFRIEKAPKLKDGKRTWDFPMEEPPKLKEGKHTSEFHIKKQSKLNERKHIFKIEGENTHSKLNEGKRTNDHSEFPIEPSLKIEGTTTHIGHH